MHMYNGVIIPNYALCPKAKFKSQFIYLNFLGKKGKKGKGKTVTLNLNDFLNKGGANGGPDTTTVVMPSASW